MNGKEIIFSLCGAPGVSGAEGSAAQVASQLLARHARVRKDALGSVIGEIDGEDPHILLDAHLDQIGLIVTDIDAQGFLRVEKCGGIDTRTLYGQNVTVWGVDPLPGVLCSTPPHLRKAEDVNKAPEWKELAVDIGLNAQQACEKVRLGDRITFDTKPAQLLNERMTAPALDDRAGVAALLLALEKAKGKLRNRVTVAFTVQEEVGTRGAGPAAFSIKPDKAVVVDVSFAMSPGCPAHKCGKLGGGAMIGVAPTLSAGMSADFVRLAQTHGIAHTLEVMGGETGTNADVIDISRGGVETGLLSIPLRYMHTSAEVVDLRDVEAVADLLARYLMELGGARE